MIKVDNELLLTARHGLPSDLRFLVDRYPRENWQSHENLGTMARFWLERHDMFRELGEMLNGGIADYREERLDAARFASWFAPRLRFFLQQLFGHHHIEDEHYFPVFAAAEKRLRRGFDMLDNDHLVLHEALEKNAEGAGEFIEALQKGRDQSRFAADDYADQTARLVDIMMRHLEDEEDLIIPVILDQGERELGLA